MAPSNKKSSSTLSKKVPKSAFTGKYSATPVGLKGKKDTRNQMIIEGLQPGVMTVYFKKAHCNEEAFLQPDIKKLQENRDIMEELGINAILIRKGSDGVTEMKQNPSSDFGWRQLILIIGQDNNSASGRKEIADKLVEYFNSDASQALYKYPRKVKFAEDNTGNPLRPLDACFLNSDVPPLMAAAYPDMELDEVSTFPDIMATFWTDVSYGQKAVETFMANYTTNES
jgi:hypothetical protein